MAQGGDLGDHRDRHLPRRLAADVQADGCMQSADVGRGEARAKQSRDPFGHPPPGARAPDIEGRRRARRRSARHGRVRRRGWPRRLPSNGPARCGARPQTARPADRRCRRSAAARVVRCGRRASYRNRSCAPRLAIASAVGSAPSTINRRTGSYCRWKRAGSRGGRGDGRRTGAPLAIAQPGGRDPRVARARTARAWPRRPGGIRSSWISIRAPHSRRMSGQGLPWP